MTDTNRGTWETHTVKTHRKDTTELLPLDAHDPVADLKSSISS